MVIVFSCFAAATISNIEQIGLGLTVAVAHRRDHRALPAGTGDNDPARPVQLVGAGLAQPGRTTGSVLARAAPARVRDRTPGAGTRDGFPAAMSSGPVAVCSW